MPVLSEANNLGDVLKYAAPTLYSRDRVTVASGRSLALGAVVAIVTATGKVVALDPAGLDGSEVAVGVLVDAVDATAADAPGVMIARHAIVADHALVWPAAITQAQKDAATAQLKAAGILVRSGA